MRFLPIALALLLSACASGPGPVQYLLRGVEDATRVAQLPSIGLREIELPLYARRPEMPIQTPEGSITSSDDHRWAEDTPRAATRLVARRLEQLGGGKVYAEPWPSTVTPEVIVAVDVGQFAGPLGGEVKLDGNIIVTRPSQPGETVSQTFSVSAQALDDGHAALAAAYGAALSGLADRIAQVVQSGR